MNTDPLSVLKQLQTQMAQFQSQVDSTVQQLESEVTSGINYVPPPPPPVFDCTTALRKVGFKGIVGTHVMPWVGEPGHIHRESSYSSNDPSVISAQLDNMQAVGIGAVILTWRGIDANGGWDQAVANLFMPALAARNMRFAYCCDPNLLKYRRNQALTPTQEIIRQLSSPGVQAVLNSPSYMPEHYVLDFLTGFNVDWASVEASLPNVKHLMRHQGYEWPSLESITDVQTNHMNPAMRIPGVAYRFNDAGCPLPYGVTNPTLMTGRDYTQSVWQNVDPKLNPALAQPCRINLARSGGYYLDCVASIAASPSALSSPYAAIVTWNDYDEGTDIESNVVGLTGIRIGK